MANRYSDSIWLTLVLVFVLLPTCYYSLDIEIRGQDHGQPPPQADDDDNSNDDEVSVISYHGVHHYPAENWRHGHENYDEGNLQQLLEEQTHTNESENEKINGTDSKRDSAKRFAPNLARRLWMKGIVPYIFTSQINEYDINEIRAAIHELEHHTCIRFVPWVKNETKHKYGLEKESHLKFEKWSNCASIIGPLSKGQGISCCGRGTCLHELGHALGYPHGQVHPLRHGWTRINWNFLDKKKWEFNRVENIDNYMVNRYDFTDKMHYSSWGKRPLYSFLFKEFTGIGRGNMHYFYMTTAQAYRCKERYCPNFEMKCENDGFVSLVDGVCKCICPPGLDPNTGCNTVKNHISAPTLWPVGTYALLQPTTGCPGNNEFKEGTRKHWSDGNSWIGDDFHLKGDFNKSSFEYNFCVKERYGTRYFGTVASWERGRYCILRKAGVCPKGFLDGFIKFDDAKQTREKTNSVSGSLPDGEFGKDTLFRFCCRDDGFSGTPIHLPTDKPFILFNKQKDRCQHVAGMYSHQSFLSFDVDEKNGLSAYNQSIPYFHIWQTNYEPRFCHYVPLNTDCGGEIFLTKDQPVAVFTSPGYPNKYPRFLHCSWFIMAPKHSKIVLSFDDFHTAKYIKLCVDSVEIRYLILGMNSFKYCGNGEDESFTSYENVMTVIFKTDHKNERKGFKARVKLVSPEDHCYNMADGGLSYRGRVNFTRDFQPCLPWSEVKNCTHHLFNPVDFEGGLEENFCRNPDKSVKPWCYTKMEDDFCDRNYCDVCLKETKFDNYYSCEQFKAQGQCEKNPIQALSQCAKTCDVPLPPVRTNGCQTPEVSGDSVPLNMRKNFYSVGHTVSVKCRSSSVIVTRRCLSDGSWSSGGYVCGGCPSGWSPFKRSCYKYFPSKKTYTDASNHCSAPGGTIATMKNQPEMQFVASLGHKAWRMWIGATDRAIEGMFRWADNSAVTWNNWRKGEPNNQGNEDCTVTDGEDKNITWNDIPCSSKQSYVCKLIPQGCPEGWLIHGASCYKFHIGALDYAGAESKCQKTGAVVASAKSLEEQEAILSISSSADGVWLGATDRAAEGEFRWADGSPVTVSNWNKGEPNNRGDEDCVIMTREGRWNDYPCNHKTQFVCKLTSKGCQPDWVFYDSRCYKYHPESKVYADAISVCNAEDAVVSTARSPGELSFIISLKPNSGRMWLGLTDTKTEGTFLWEDGSTLDWTNWKKGEPNDYNGEDCAVELEGYWNDVPCTTQGYQFVCKHNVGATQNGHHLVCADRRTDCAIMDERFDACAKHPDFAWSQCRKTCKICT